VLNIKNVDDLTSMKNYYRMSDMINLLYFFPQLSPIKDLVIVSSIEDYYKNQNEIQNLPYNRVDTVKGRNPDIGIENNGLYKEEDFIELFNKLKAKDPYAVLVLFSIDCPTSKRYERYAGISVGVDLGKDVYIDAVSKGFDGREVSKSICTHERYYIPWFELRNICISNFHEYQTFKISEDSYQKTRKQRVEFLRQIGVTQELIDKNLPTIYEDIPDFIWQDVITNLLKSLEKQEDFLKCYGFTNFAISGHTEEKHFLPWQMFDKDRYMQIQKQNNGTQRKRI